jgi:carboxyl-terminal processing protease
MSIVPGSPSWKQGQLKAGDIILKVAQGDKEPVDVIGMKVDDAVKIIRGKKGTEVRLTVKKPDASNIIIPIVRDIVILEESFAQSAVIEQNKKIGYIRLPGFYADFTQNKSGGHYAADDVRKEIIKLKEEKISGLILDLRDNGGGSLTEVVKMVGLFIRSGPVVQVKTRTEGIKLHEDPDNGAVLYDGPLVVMINENSASASEILAAAIQDYKRGVIVGSNSFGKGTVQSFFELDNIRQPGAPSISDPLGAVKVTIQKFYRVNGGSTQLKGVAPDIALPDLYEQMGDGEQDLDFPMPWDQIASAQYEPLQAPDYDNLRKNSSSRIASSKAFKIIMDKAGQLKREKDQTLESLHLDDYLASRKKIEEENKIFKAFDEPVKGMKVTALNIDLKTIEGDTSKIVRKDDWIGKLGKDVYLSETVNILTDMK